jgi:hypothetical protein
VATPLAYETVADTWVVPVRSVTVLALTVVASRASLKVAVTDVDVGTLVAPAVGVVDATVGGVVSGGRLKA